MLDLEEVQGDVVVGLQKNFEDFIFFKITEPYGFKNRVIALKVISGITNAKLTQDRELIIDRWRKSGRKDRGKFEGLNVGFTKSGLDLILAVRPKLEPAFERGADRPDTITALNDPPKSEWLPTFASDRIDGVFLVTGPDRASATAHSNALLRLLGASIKVVYSEMGNVRPGAERGHEHFGFLDGVSQPGIRGLTPPSKPSYRRNEGLPGQDLVWPGEFVFGYPGQHPTDPAKPGPPPKMAAPWMRNGSFMVFRRLEQKVPEFRRFAAERAVRLGMDRELLMARMVGRWKSGAPLELAPLRDNPALGADEGRNNDFGFADDPLQRKCPYAAHIRKMYRRDDSGAEAEAQRHRIIRAGIPFGPEVEPGETTTRHSRGLMFVCYQTSIERQFEFLQRRYANDPEFPAGKRRLGGGAVVPGYDPIIGQAHGNGVRKMDEPYPNYPAGDRRTMLEIPDQFVNLTAAAYFFMPSISALRSVLS
jgi:Dyp-type peroxidase family